MTRLLPVNRGNWERVLALEADEIQRDFLPSTTFSLLQAHYEGLDAFAIYDGPELVGYMVAGEIGGVYWISRILVDQHHQQQGHGTAALRQLLDKARTRPGLTEARTTIDNRNTLAELFFQHLGFERTGYQDSREFVMGRDL